MLLWWWNRYVDKSFETTKSDYHDILSQSGSSLVIRKNRWSRFMDRLFSSLPSLTLHRYGFIIHLSVSIFLIGLSTYFLV